MASETSTSPAARRGGLVQIWALLAGTAFLVLGNGLQGTLIGVRAGIEGMDEVTIGVVMSAYFVGFVAGSMYVPKLVHGVGHIRTFAALASIDSAVALAFAIFVSPAAWIALRAVHGACYAGLIIVVESWLNAAAERHDRGRLLAVYSIVLYAAWAGGQPLIDVAPATGFLLFCLVSICMSLALVPITLTRADVPGVVDATRFNLKRLWSVSPACSSPASASVPTSAWARPSRRRSA